MFIYRGARLIRNVFPSWNHELEIKLIDLIRTADEQNLLFVMAILRGYEGKPFLHNICKEIVKILAIDSKYLQEVEVILESTGVVSGEFGLMEEYKRRKDEIKEWLNDTDNKVREFAQRYTSNLEKMIASEKRRAEEGIELRKHEYGVPDSEKEDSEM